MKKQWIKTADFNYRFLVDDNETGKMEIQLNTIANKAICTIEGKELMIRRTGFWKSNIEITDQNGMVILKTYPEKWYANSLVIEFENQKLQLSIRNNPLAEFVISEQQKEMLAYGLATENGKAGVRISSSDKSPLILDFLLWYLFIPIATENLSDNDAFLLLAVA